MVEVLPPTPAEGEVLIEVIGCGICGSDLARYRCRGSNEPSMESQWRYTPGHEFFGWLDSGDGERRLVVVDPILNRGTGAAPAVIGYHRDGGFAERVSVPSNSVVDVRLRQGVDPMSLTLSEPLAVACHAAACWHHGAPDVLIIGDGTIGVLLANRLTARGVAPHLLGRRESRTGIARQFGARAPDGRAYDLIFVTAPGAEVVDQAVGMVRPSGEIVQLGYLEVGGPGLPAAAFNQIVRRQILMRGSFGYTHEEFREAATEIASGNVDTMSLVDRIVGLDRAVVDGFDALERREVGAQKVLVRVR